MPKREVVLKREVVFNGLSGLFAFGGGVAVGANWPRASNFVGFILQRLGIEFTDLALWMWDPEKSAAGASESAPVRRPTGKNRTQVLRIKAGDPTKKRTRKKEIDPHENWIRPDGIDSPVGRRNGVQVNPPLMQSGDAGSGATRVRTTIAQARIRPVKSAPRNVRTKPVSGDTSLTRSKNAATRTARTKWKGGVAKNGRKIPRSRRGGKTSAFPQTTVLPGAAALN